MRFFVRRAMGAKGKNFFSPRKTVKSLPSYSEKMVSFGIVTITKLVVLQVSVVVIWVAFIEMPKGFSGLGITRHFLGQKMQKVLLKY